MFDVMNCDTLCHRSNGHADWFQPMAFLAILDARGVLQGERYQTMSNPVLRFSRFSESKNFRNVRESI